MAQQKQELEPRQKTLEERLWKGTHIGIKTRISGVIKNIKDNAINFLPAAFLIGVIGTSSALSGWCLHNHMQKAKTYEQAFRYINFLTTATETIQKEDLILIKPEVLDKLCYPKISSQR